MKPLKSRRTFRAKIEPHTVWVQKQGNIASRCHYSYKTLTARYFAFEYGAPFFYYADEQWRAGGKFPFE